MRKTHLFPLVGGLLVVGLFLFQLLQSKPVASGAVRQIELQSEYQPLKRSDPGQTRLGRLHFMGAVSLKSRDPDFGGISGIIWEEDCQRLLGVTDAGSWVVLDPREDNGRLIGMAAGWIAPILNMQGQKPADKRAADAEELVRTDEGDVWVFYEQTHRAERFEKLSACNPSSLTQKPVEQRRFPITRNWKPNAGMEAATADGQSLIAISERTPATDGGHQAFVAEPDGRIIAFSWQAPEYFDPTAMDLYRDADDKRRILVLHRRFSPLRGLAASITEATLADALPKQRVQGREVAMLAPPYTVDNMEGLAIRRENNQIYLYLISDDNFNFFQKTILMKFRLLPDSDNP